MKKISAIEYYNRKACQEYEKEYKDQYWQLEFIVSLHHIKQYLTPNIRIIDIGAGIGQYSKYLSQFSFPIHLEAIEPAPEMISCFQKNNPDIPIQKGRIENIPYADQTFDIAIAMGDVLSYAENIELAISELYRILKPQGVLIASVDNFHYFLKDILKHGSKSDIEYFRKTGKTTVGNRKFYFHSQTFKYDQLSQLATKYHFQLVDTIFKLVAFTENEPIKDINSAFHIEQEINRNIVYIGNAQHIQFVWKKKG